MSTSLSLRAEWLDAPDVSTPELAATWARYEMWSESDCLTQVESKDAGFRRGVYGTLYPLAEWIVENWWLLTASIRPSSVPTRYWTWPNICSHRWLSQHDLRAAGNGKAWPDLTVVPQGAMTCIHWSADAGYGARPVRFMSSGMRLAPAGEVATGLAEIVNLVLERLNEVGLRKTRLAEDWANLGRLSSDEQEFCAIAARLGLDPFVVSDSLTDQIVEAADLG